MKQFFLFLLLCLVAACSSIDCEVDGRVACQYAVQRADGVRDTLPYYFSVIAHVPMDGNDTVLINQQMATTAFALPMSYNGDIDTLTLFLTQPVDSATVLAAADTVYIAKQNIEKFESPDCQPRFTHNITALHYTRHFIDSMYVANPTVTNATQPNIILRPRR